MKVLTILLLIASVALNVCFISGCKAFHDQVYGDPCRYAPEVSNVDASKAELERVAKRLDIEPKQLPSELSSTIIDKFNRSNVEVPFAYDGFEELANALGPEQEEAMRRYHQFITELQGKCVIVLEPEEN